MKWGKKFEVLRWLLFMMAGALVSIQLYMMFYFAPTEKYMGHVQRLMYIHVPSAFVAFLAFFIVFCAGVLYLLTRNRVWDHIAVSSAEIGVLFTTLTLITGSLWARPVWNSWWVWEDPRLITSLILWFIYIAYFMIRSSVQGEQRMRTFSAVFGIIGFIDVPIVYFSVKWWRTIHPKVIDGQGIHMPPDMAVTFVLSIISFISLYMVLLWYRTAYEQSKARVKQMAEKRM